MLAKTLCTIQIVETTTLVASPFIAFSTDSLKSICLLFRPATISLSPIKKIGQGPIFSPTLDVSLTLGFMISTHGRNFQTGEPGDHIADNEQKLHPQRRMPKPSKEDF